MIGFTTLFNVNYAPQGVCLIESILANISVDHKVFALCLDNDTYKILDRIFGNKISLINLTDIIDPEISEIKEQRKFNEFCWTITPTLIRYVSEQYPEINEVFYCDADTIFLKCADKFFIDFQKSSKSVYITEHGYDPVHDQSNTSGLYCVQLIGFKNGKHNECLNYWDQECRKWCFDRFEDGKFGDQKYLENFEEKFPDKIYVEPSLKHFQAPWNCNYYRNSDAMFFHFHSLRIVSENYVHSGNYHINRHTYDNIYTPYIRRLRHTVRLMREMNIKFTPQMFVKSNIVQITYEVLSQIKWHFLTSLKLRKIK